MFLLSMESCCFPCVMQQGVKVMMRVRAAFHCPPPSFMTVFLKHGCYLDKKTSIWILQVRVFLTYSPARIKNTPPTPSFKYQFLFSSTKNDGWLLDCVFCRDRTAPMEWLWQKKPCLEINYCVIGQTLHTVNHSVGCLKGFHLSNSAFLHEMNKLHHFRDRFQFWGSSNFILSD